MARTGFFSRHSATEADTRADAAERTAEERRDAEVRADERDAEKVEKVEQKRTRYPTTTAPSADTEPDTVPATREHVRARTSLLATLGLVVGLSATYAALSGRLAPVAVAVGVLGALLSLGGLSAANRRGMTGHGPAFLGLLASIAGIVLGVMASRHALPWLDTRADGAARLRDWLDAEIPWHNRW